MASRASLRHPSRASHVAIKEIIIAIIGIVGAENVLTASIMNKKVVVFILQISIVASFVESGLLVESDIFNPVSPLDSPSAKVIISNIPTYMDN